MYNIYLYSFDTLPSLRQLTSPSPVSGDVFAIYYLPTPQGHGQNTQQQLKFLYPACLEIASNDQLISIKEKVFCLKLMA